MADDLPSREILKQLVERIDLLERILGRNTARLRNIEQHLGIALPQQALHESRPQESDEKLSATVGLEAPPATYEVETTEVELHSVTTQVESPNLNISEATQPGSIPSQEPKPPEQKWAQPETPPPGTPATHSWINEGAAWRQATIEEVHLSSRRVRVDYDVTEADAVPPETAPVRKRRDVESMIAGSWFNWIGIIAVTLGVGFFLKFAFDKQWIGPSARVTLAALVGVGLLYVGERLRRRELRSFAYVLSGGGLLILYLAVFAAYSFYLLIGHTLAILLMVAVTTTAVLLSVRLNALPVAILGLVGGFLTPVLLSTGVDNEVGLFSYIALLDAGVLAVAYFKRWRSLDFLSFVGTVTMTLGWGFKFFSPEKVWTTLFFLSVFFLIYSLLAIFHNVLAGRLSRWFDVSLAIANATFYFGLSYLMLTEAGFDHATPATQALLLSVFFTGLFYTTWRWSSDDRLLRYNYLGAAATFLSLAVAIQLELQWVTIAWAVEALMLTWVGLRLDEKAARHAALAVFCAAVVHWFGWDMPAFAYGVDPAFVPLLNARALSGAVLVAAIAVAAWLYKRAAKLDEDERSTVKILFTLTGNAVALTLLSVDLNDYFTARLSNSATELTNLIEQIEGARHFSISVVWTLYAATMLALGLLRRSRLWRWGGLLVLLTAVGKVVVLDSSYYAASWHFPVLNQTFMAYVLLVAVLAFGARLYGRPASASESEKLVMRPALLLAANLLALAALSLEVFGYYDRSMAGLPVATSGAEIFRPFQEGKIFMLALIWTLYAACAFMFGAWRHSRVWRYGGLLLLAFTVPLVLMNLSYYDASWHVFVLNRTLAGFAVLIAALWLVVRTYARSGEAFEEAHIVRPVATVAANLFAIVALSAQAAGYYEARIFGELIHTSAPGVAGSEGQRNLELAKQLSLSVIWGLYACGLFVAARVRRLPLLRVMALVLLSLTTLKVFLVDLSSLERGYRIFSFIMLGAILLIVSYFYQRSQQRGAVKES
jgi:uncharacterized membrane protein